MSRAPRRPWLGHRPSIYARDPVPLKPWRLRRLQLLSAVAAGRRWMGGWWSIRQVEADITRAIKDGLIVLAQKDGPKLRTRIRDGAFMASHRGQYPSRIANRSKHHKRLELTDLGHALLAAMQPPAPREAQPYAKRRIWLDELNEANA